MVKVEVEEDEIRKAPRLPAMVMTKCSKNHTLVVFVDGNLQVRDVESTLSGHRVSKDALDKTGDWFVSL
ncbi:MAG: hypothetical protein ACFFAZ_08705 [Promethearchaeota archaeon]